MALASRRVKAFELDPEELDKQLEAALDGLDETKYSEQLAESVRDIRPGSIVDAKVDSVDERTGLVVLDIGGKSEGSIPISEFGDEIIRQMS